MDNCIVCCKSNEDIFSRIKTVSSEWKEWNIQRIIEKHLWWWYLRPPSNNGAEQWICRQCWQELSSFHNFYINVEKEQKLYDKLFISVIKTDNDEVAAVDIKVEEQNFVNDSMLTENLMHLEKPKRGRKKKTVDKAENIQIEELDVVQVKSENEMTDTFEHPKPDIDINMLVADEVASIDWEHCFLNESPEDTEEEKELVELEDDKLNVFLNKRATRKRQPKSNAVTKYRKKYTKTIKEKKAKVVKTLANSNVAQAMRKNDEFIADNHFELSCSICSASLCNFYKLKNHFRKEHDVLGYAMCCNKKFYKRGVLVDHINVHKDPNYFKCLRCDKALSTRRSYEKHMETHQLYETPQNAYICDKCDKSFLKKAVFDRHLLTHVPEGERNFQCSICDKKFASEYLRKQHASLTHTKKYAKICDICGKLLRDSFSFIRHMGEHNGEPPAKVKCDICGAELTNKYRLNRHKKMMHTEENQQEQVCPYCSKVSPNLNAHKHHVKYTHTLERKHACHMCDKKFRRPLELKEHLSTHTGEPLYTCPHCPRTFISSANMHKHRKLTHRKEWEEGRMKKEAKALAGKKFLKSVAAPQSETSYTDTSIMEPAANKNRHGIEMAWYTSRIGDKESDTEIRNSARSLSSSINGGSSHFNLSSRSYDTSKNSVRYVNSAAFIENNVPLTDISTGDNIKYTAMSETNSDIVPPLDINSEENYPTTRDYTFSYRKHCEPAKIPHKPDQAYETWLSAKRKLLSDEAARRKKAEELKQQEIEERKRLAKEKYEKWLEKKSQSSIGQQSMTNITVKTVPSLEIRARPQLTAEEAHARLEEWERAKRLEEERRRLLKRQEEQHRRKLEQERRQMADEAWEKWIASADKKPKPVPLNRGIFTLRGTVSDIFVNPNEWKTIVPTSNENKQ